VIEGIGNRTAVVRYNQTAAQQSCARRKMEELTDGRRFRIEGLRNNEHLSWDC